jgi:penicillin-binding protein 1B
LAFTGLGVFLALYLVVLYVIVTDRFEGKRWRLPSKVYSDSFVLYPGQDLAGAHLMDRLRRLGYHSVSGLPQRPGEYHLEPGRLEIFLHDFSYPDHDFKGFLVYFSLKNGRISKMAEPPQEEELAMVELEPELVTAFFDEAWEERNLIRLDEVPPHLIEAILSVEDTRFYQHKGVDFRSIARALWVDLKEGAIIQGGSTLTQQLVKNFYLTQERTLTRKVNEVFMALLLEMRYSKEEILEAYLNEIYLGQSGTMGIYGVGEASRFYFGKAAEAMTLGEAALLTGMIKSPNTLSPYRDPERARARRIVVLDRMLALGKITLSQYTRAQREELPKRPPLARGPAAPYFVEFVRQQLSENYPSEVLTSEGLKIFTTLDMQQQKIAEEVLAKGLEGLERTYPHLRREDPQQKLQSCLIALQPQTGHIKAMVGGRDFQVSQFNRATQARRQPGSLFKPFVYAAAISQSLTAQGQPFTATTLIEDSPFTLMSETGIWNPQNYDKMYHGIVTLRTALENSLNVATARMAQEIGIDRVIGTARAMGIQSPLKDVPSLALGTSEVVPLEIASAYAVIANGGVKVEPLAIKEVVDTTGQVLERRALDMTTVLTPQEAYLLTYLLEGVVDRGTARGVRALGFDRPVAGKTGTTSDYKDAWFLGFTPDLLSVVWVGFDQSMSVESSPSSPDSSGSSVGELRLTGAQAALPLWTEFMKRSMVGLPASRFVVPPRIVYRMIDPKTGLLSTQDCPEAIREAFIEGTEPQESCGQPGGLPKGFFKWFKHLISTP